MSRTEELEDFTAWVAHEVMSEDFEDGFFAEVACRKLYKMGFVEKDGDKWIEVTESDWTRGDEER